MYSLKVLTFILLGCVTQHRHGLSTDSSFRFRTWCRSERYYYALKEAALLVKETQIASEIKDVYPIPIANFG